MEDISKLEVQRQKKVLVTEAQQRNLNYVHMLTINAVKIVHGHCVN